MGIQHLRKVSTRSAAVNCIPILYSPNTTNLWLFCIRSTTTGQINFHEATSTQPFLEKLPSGLSLNPWNHSRQKALCASSDKLPYGTPMSFSITWVSISYSDCLSW